MQASRQKKPAKGIGRCNTRLHALVLFLLALAVVQYLAWCFALAQARPSFLSFRRGFNASKPPLIVDTALLTHKNCLGDAFDAISDGKTLEIDHATGESKFIRLPFDTWNKAMCAARPSACSGRCDLLSPTSDCQVPASAFKAASCVDPFKPMAPWRLRCPFKGSEVECLASHTLSDAADADGLVLFHVSLSRDIIRNDPLIRKLLLHPAERSARSQVWQLVAMWESNVYYPAGADVSLLSEFDITFGSDRSNLAMFSLSYLPDWNAMMRPVSLAEKLAHPALPRMSNITLVQSNCDSLSGREVFLRELLQLIPVDSFGGCLNNRDAGVFGMAQAGWDASQTNKHTLMHGYKFVLAFENSIAYDYFSEKALDAWESGAVPVYRGAPNIDDYLPGAHSLIHVTDEMTPAKLADLLRYLDSNDTAYEEYHEWRRASDAVRTSSPLGHMEKLSAYTGKVQCAACVAVHARRELDR